MALPTDLKTLDYADGGLAFYRDAASALSNTNTLDYADAGLPFFAQPSIPSPILDAGLNTISVTAPTAVLTTATILITVANVLAVTARTTRVLGWYRVYPALRDERIAFTIVGTHVIPEYSYQDPALIP